MLDASGFTSLALGAATGLVMTLTGAGGGILGVPLLLFGLHLSMQQAAPVGLLAVGLSAALSTGLGLREGIVRYRAAAWVGGCGMLSAPLGLALARRLPHAALLLLFVLLLLAAAWRMLRQAGLAEQALALARQKAPCVLHPERGRLIWTRPCAWALACTGWVSGFFSGLLGVGGGFVIIPSLTRYTDLDARSVVATSLGVMTLVSASGTLAAATQGGMPWPIALPFALGAVAVVPLGRALARHCQGRWLQRGFALVCLGVALSMLAQLGA